MKQSKRAARALGLEGLRPLGVPSQVDVEVDSAGLPTAVRRRAWRAARPVARVQDRWRIDDEWWRERPISRAYFDLLLAQGDVVTVYQDLVDGTWHEQRP